MKKKHIIIISIFAGFVSLLLIISKQNHEDPFNEPYPIYPNLVVNGQTIKDEHMYIVDRGGIYLSQLPFTKIINALGASVEWIDKETARISIEDQEYTLSLPDKALYRMGSTINCLEKGKANIFSLRVYQECQELYFDNYTMENTLDKIGLQVTIILDIDNNTVVVTTEV